MKKFDGLSVEEAKLFIEQNVDKGILCPCCNQFVKKYKRKLHHSMALTLIYLCRYDRRAYNWIDVKDFLRQYKLKNTHDWTLLKHWGLIHEKPKDETSKTRTSGYWKITEKGYLFMENKIRVPERIILLNNDFLGYSENTTDIKEALGNYFNYEELMNPYYRDL